MTVIERAPQMPLLSRRRLLASGMALPLVGAWGLRAAPVIDPAADWTPPSGFLRDLPRQMQALGVPGLGIAVVEEVTSS